MINLNRLYSTRVQLPAIAGPNDVCGPDGCPPGGSRGGTSGGSTFGGGSGSGSSRGSSAPTLGQFLAGGTQVYYFTSPTCPNCDTIKDNIAQLQSQSPVPITVIDTSTSRGLQFANAASVRGVPHIMVTQDGAVTDNYSGPSRIVAGADQIIAQVSGSNGQAQTDSIESGMASGILSRIDFSDYKTWGVGLGLLWLLNRR